MTSLSEKISLLANPTPTHLDPEDDVNIETSATIKELGENYVPFTNSELRSKAAVLLEDCDPKYVGKKVSRQYLSSIYSNDPRKDVHSSDKNADEEDDDDADFESDEDEEPSEDDDLEGFKQSLHQQVENDENSEEDNESMESTISDDENTKDTQDMVNQFSHFDVTSDMEKGAAVKEQLEVINRLCEARIRLQKLLTLSNTFPQKTSWTSLKKVLGKEMEEPMNKASITAETILNNCLNFQSEYCKRIKKQKDTANSDEEIASDTDEEMQKKTDKKGDFDLKLGKLSKHKSKSQQYEEILADHLKSLTPYRNSILQTWDEKTKLSSGRITQKSFSSFETSVVKQIEQILQDKNRLIKRTQLKRSLYKIIGKPDFSENIKDNDDDTSKEPKSKQDLLLKDYDPEIFDDDDFYRQFLRDVIESKSVGIDPVSLRKQLEIQNVRSKIKRKVDTKASKGRKIRYDVDPKIAGFAIAEPTLVDEARESILRSLCGGGCVSVS